ncbi:PEP-CTERM sorting domain-containing protein [Kiritimatiellota bacterium B12222]|nr:PEP-CTERM sorting domain-containing protein [Kiritimatiellota bacterium B12222]
MNTTTSLRTALILGLVGLTALLSSAQAATLGYWRFEDSPGFLNDSSGNGHNLTAEASAVQAEIPATGNGSTFSNPIPLTSASNVDLANLTGSKYLSASDSDDWTQSAFSLELYFNAADISDASSSIMVSHFDSGSNDRGWFLGIHRTSKLLQVAFSNDGQTGAGHTEVIDSPWAIDEDKDYFAAVVVDMTDTSADGITFYLQNLTDGGALLSSNATHSLTSIHNSDAQFRIGNQISGNGNIFDGVVDEVRFSSGLLSESELMAIPEPSTVVLMLGALATCGLFRRRR